MKARDMVEKSIGTSYGIGFVGILVLVGLMTSVFILWSLSCLGGMAFDLVNRVC